VLVAAWLVVAVAVVACGTVAANSPVDPVRDALRAIAEHDDAAAQRALCADQRAREPFIVSGIGWAVDGLDGDDGQALIAFDTTRVTVAETAREGDTATVHLGGVLVQRIDPDAWEAAYRTAAQARGETPDDAWIAEIRGRIGDGTVELPLDQDVRVQLGGGAWSVCEPAASP
jgi:hypothetical protein